MSDKKVLFFDIDGTLWLHGSVIPESTFEAIKRLREAGHVLFINSGRTMGFIRDERLLGLGFDGIASGCGTMIEYRGKVVYYHRIAPDLARRTVDTLLSFDFVPILEGRDYLYFDSCEGGEYLERIRSQIPDGCLSLKENYPDWEFSKFSGAIRRDGEELLERLKPDFDPIKHSPVIYEFVPVGHGKGKAISDVLAILGRDKKDAVAFGDSANDIDMFLASGTAVVMGNGSDEAKAHADLVTNPIDEDGLYNACVRLGLI